MAPSYFNAFLKNISLFMRKCKTHDLETKLIILNRVGYRTFLKQTAHLIDFLGKRLGNVVIAT